MTTPVFADAAPRLTEEGMRAFERSLGVQLPSELRAHCLETNGGAPESRRYIVTPEGTEYDVWRFLPIGVRRRDREVLLDDVYRDLVLERGEIPKELFPFAVNGGDDYCCIVIATGEVVFYAMDHCDEPEVATEVVATNLQAFFDMMITEAEFYGRDAD